MSPTTEAACNEMLYRSIVYTIIGFKTVRNNSIIQGRTYNLFSTVLIYHTSIQFNVDAAR